jgi:hypothetical protein
MPARVICDLNHIQQFFDLVRYSHGIIGRAVALEVKRAWEVSYCEPFTVSAWVCPVFNFEFVQSHSFRFSGIRAW